MTSHKFTETGRAKKKKTIGKHSARANKTKGKMGIGFGNRTWENGTLFGDLELS